MENQCIKFYDLNGIGATSYTCLCPHLLSVITWRQPFRDDGEESAWCCHRATTPVHTLLATHLEYTHTAADSHGVLILFEIQLLDVCIHI